MSPNEGSSDQRLKDEHQDGSFIAQCVLQKTKTEIIKKQEGRKFGKWETWEWNTEICLMKTWILCATREQNVGIARVKTASCEKDAW